MELRFYLQTLLRQKKLIIIIMIACAVLAYGLGKFVVPTRYAGSVYFTIAYRDDQQTEEYKIGNYWANQASIEFARTVSGWPKNPRFVDEIYSTAGVNQSADTNFVGKLFGALSVNRVERANIDVAFNSSSQSNADKIADAIITVFETKIAEYNAEAATNYNVIGASKAFAEKAPDPSSYGWAGLLIGLLFGIIYAYLYEFMKGVIIHPEQVEEILKKPRFDLVNSSMSGDEIAYSAGYYNIHPFKHMVVAGLQCSPAKFAYKLSNAVSDTAKKLDVIDATYAGTGIHTYFKAKANRIKDLSQLEKKWTANSKDRGTHLLARPVSARLTGSVLKELIRKNPTIITANLPLQLDILESIEKPELVLLVRLGMTQKETLKSIVQYLGSQPYKVVIMK